jgi:hypothetical protein
MTGAHQATQKSTSTPTAVGTSATPSGVWPSFRTTPSVSRVRAGTNSPGPGSARFPAPWCATRTRGVGGRNQLAVPNHRGPKRSLVLQTGHGQSVAAAVAAPPSQSMASRCAARSTLSTRGARGPRRHAACSLCETRSKAARHPRGVAAQTAALCSSKPSQRSAAR